MIYKQYLSRQRYEKTLDMIAVEYLTNRRKLILSSVLVSKLRTVYYSNLCTAWGNSYVAKFCEKTKFTKSNFLSKLPIFAEFLKSIVARFWVKETKSNY